MRLLFGYVKLVIGVISQLAKNGEKKYWLSWELNPDYLPSACNQQDLLGREGSYH